MNLGKSSMKSCQYVPVCVGAITLLLAATVSAASAGKSNEGGQALKWQEDQRSSLVGIDTADPSPQVWPVRPGDTDWRSYNKELDGNRYADLSSINPDSKPCRIAVG